MKFLNLLFVVFLASAVWPGSMQADWKQLYGGMGNSEAYSILPAADGGYVLGGYTNSKGAGGEDFYLIKTDDSGNEQWERTFGGPGDERMTAMAGAPGGYYLAGLSAVDSGLVIRVDSGGNEVWSAPLSKTYSLYSLANSSDGGCALLSYRITPSSSGVSVIKLDKDGQEEWETPLRSVSTSRIIAVSDGYVVLDDSSDTVSQVVNVELLKLNRSGNIVWNSTLRAIPFSSSGVALDVVSVMQKDDGGYVALVELSNNFQTFSTGPKGNVLSSSTFAKYNRQYAQAMAQEPEGGYAIGGWESAASGPISEFIVSTDKDAVPGEDYPFLDNGLAATMQSFLAFGNRSYILAGTIPENRSFKMLLAKVSYSAQNVSPAPMPPSYPQPGQSDMILHATLSAPSTLKLWVHDSSNQGVESWISVNPPSRSGSISPPERTDRNGLFRGVYNETGQYTIIISPIGHVSGNLTSDIGISEAYQYGNGRNSSVYTPPGTAPEQEIDLAQLAQIEIPDYLAYALIGMMAIMLIVLAAIFYMALSTKKERV